MPSELSFSPAFFSHGDEPYGGGPGPSDRPASVWQALESMSDEDWDSMCLDLGLSPDFTDYETIIDMIRQTNTCSSLTSPVEVWIDPEGIHTVLVYDREE